MNWVAKILFFKIKKWKDPAVEMPRPLKGEDCFIRQLNLYDHLVKRFGEKYVSEHNKKGDPINTILVNGYWPADKDY